MYSKNVAANTLEGLLIPDVYKGVGDIIYFLQQLHPLEQALLAGIFTWGMTALGAASVFLTSGVSRRVLDLMLGFTAGVMIAASYWSLLAPAIEMSEGRDVPAWLPAVMGFLLGGLFLRGIDKILPHLQFGSATEATEGLKTSCRRNTLLVLAVTLHNIPEGLAVGVAFGAAASGYMYSLPAAIALTTGIGIQNFPEGLVVSVPLRREGMSCFKSFNYGQASAIVEPIASVVGVAAVILVRPILPYALAFAAGAMIFVVVEEIIPESQHGGNAPLATIGTMIGFSVMMVLDVAFG
ncbi:Metal transporter, ZIP family [Methanosarcina siciliae C2J]|uniref:Metal transporter, ZIP family n=2 Tax=Methanosarcina siciliae TaxID=38027 RepID=A0A0E3LDL1_9EURY|nr:Metal transporter, ZIP family [Methanosarcina siciliae C2J]